MSRRWTMLDCLAWMRYSGPLHQGPCPPTLGCDARGRMRATPAAPRPTRPRTVQVRRQSRDEMRKCTRGGNTPWLTPEPTNGMIIARARRRTNQRATMIVGINVNDPWPRKRSAAKPRRSCKGLSTNLIETMAKPKATDTVVSTTRAPWRSMSQPIITMPTAPTSVAPV